MTCLRPLLRNLPLGTPPCESVTSLAYDGCVRFIEVSDFRRPICHMTLMATDTGSCAGTLRLPLAENRVEVVLEGLALHHVAMTLQAVCVGDRPRQRCRLDVVASVEARGVARPQFERRDPPRHTRPRVTVDAAHRLRGMKAGKIGRIGGEAPGDVGALRFRMTGRAKRISVLSVGGFQPASDEEKCPERHEPAERQHKPSRTLPGSLHDADQTTNLSATRRAKAGRPCGRFPHQKKSRAPHATTGQL